MPSPIDNAKPGPQRPGLWSYAPDLGPRCRATAERAIQLVVGLTQQASALAQEGFAVPAPEALEHAARIFESVQKMPGGENLRHSVEPDERVAIACALASAVEGFEREFDLDAFGAWWDFSETDLTVRQARAVLALVNAGLSTDVLRWTTEDLARHDREEGESR